MKPEVVASQIRASLQMLRSTIESCPDALWQRDSEHNAYWVLAYHTVYFAHLYLSPTKKAFVPFERPVEGKSGFGWSDLGDWSKLTPGDIYAKEDVLAYCDHVHRVVPELVASAPFDAPSGFHWLPFSKGEAHLYNLRHIQHHAGQLADRLRQIADVGTKWIHAVDRSGA